MHAGVTEGFIVVYTCVLHYVTALLSVDRGVLGFSGGVVDARGSVLREVNFRVSPVLT